MSDIRPLGNRVIVKRQEQDKQTEGGIFLPDQAVDENMECDVVAVGSGFLTDKGERSPLTVQKGDTVLVGSYCGSEIEVDGEDVLIVREDEILAIVEEEDE